MNTKFDVTLNANTDMAKTFAINLGIDVLEGMMDADIRALATRSKVINIQAPLRTNKKIVDTDTIAQHIGKTYPNVSVDVGTVKEESDNTKMKKLVAKFGSIEAVMAKLAEIDGVKSDDD